VEDKMLSPNVFRQYDIRGIVGEELTLEGVKSIGKAYGTYMKNFGFSRISLGRDGRISSEDLRQSMLEGILSTGLHVIDLGICPTPLLYFSLFQLGVDGGIMITGSHNPPEYNGIKICVGKETIYGEEIQRLRKLIEEGNFSSGIGRLSHHEIIPDYIEYVKDNVKLNRRLKVVIDAGNGTVGLVAPELYRALGCHVIELYCELDGLFPHHHPDPVLPENLVDIISMVKKEKADLGIAYDGDGDRIGVIDDGGEIIWADQLMILFAQEILKERPGATFLSEVKASQVMYDMIEKMGGKAIMWKAGHSLIKSKMKEVKAVLAAEVSGHICFADRYFGYDDAIYSGARLLELLGNIPEGMKLSHLFREIPKTFTTPEIRIECPDDKKFLVVEKMGERFKGDNIIRVDGLRIVLEDGWGLIRASNTQPVMVLRFEANSPQRLQQIKTLIEEELRRCMLEVLGS